VGRVAARLGELIIGGTPGGQACLPQAGIRFSFPPAVAGHSPLRSAEAK